MQQAATITKKPRDYGFYPGWKGGPGNPFAAHVNRLRSAMLQCITPEDFKDVARALLREAKTGSVPAIALLMDRTIGKVTQEVDIVVSRGPDITLDTLPPALIDRCNRLALELSAAAPPALPGVATDPTE